MEVDEARTCDVDFVDLVAAANVFNKHRGKLTRVLTGRLGESHGNVARKITMRRIARSLHCALNREVSDGIRQLRHARQGVLKVLRDYGLHYSGAVRICEPQFYREFCGYGLKQFDRINVYRPANPAGNRLFLEYRAKLAQHGV